MLFLLDQHSPLNHFVLNFRRSYLLLFEVFYNAWKVPDGTTWYFFG